MALYMPEDYITNRLHMGIRRIREWIVAVLRATQEDGRIATFVNILKHVPRAKKIERRLWRRRVKVCLRCPIYNRKYKTCDRDGMGCMCYTPLNALLLQDPCWGYEEFDGELGWPGTASAGRPSEKVH